MVGKIILPFTLLRRLECVLEPNRNEVCRFSDIKLHDDFVFSKCPLTKA